MVEETAEAVREVARVAGEHLVASGAAEHHRHALACRTADQVRGDRRRIGHRLLEVPHRFREQIEDVRLEDPLGRVRVEQRRDTPRMDDVVGHDLVTEVFRGEADRVGAHPIAGGGHPRDDRRRVDAAAQERAERDVAHHLPSHALRHRLGDRVDPLPLRALLRREREIPVLPRLHSVAVDPRVVPGRQLLDAAERGARIGHPEKREVVGERRLVERCTADEREERPELGREPEHAVGAGDVERLDAEPVPSQEELLVAIVPDGEREDPVEARQHRGSLEREEPQQHLGVAVAREALPGRLELGAELAEVVELAVVRDPPALGEGHRLRARGRRVEDREAPVPETGGRVTRERDDAASVRAAMGHGVGHQTELAFVGAPHRSADAAHDAPPFAPPGLPPYGSG